MISSAQNTSSIITNFVLVGLIEMESFRYLYALFAFALYVITMSICLMIVYVTQAEESLHEPMYFFICHLVFNVMVGSSAYLPKLFIDLLTECSTISLSACLSQGFFIQGYGSVEIFAFTAIAYDRFLAVGHPLRYHSLMTNLTCAKVIIAIWIFVLMAMAAGVLLTARLTFCAVNINSVYCESISLQRLACGDITINFIYGTTWTLFFVIGCMLVIVYCYIRTILICLKLSGEASQRAMYTLVTHVVAFSIFMVGTMFVVFRYRVNGGSLSTVAHVAICVSGLSFSIAVNPLIYGLRTEALRVKILKNLHTFWSK
ncbi:olfactory receptor 1500-like [Lithobates pipiens]